MTSVYVGRTLVEVIELGTPKVNTGRSFVEVVETGSPKVYVGQSFVEVIYANVVTYSTTLADTAMSADGFSYTFVDNSALADTCVSADSFGATLTRSASFTSTIASTDYFASSSEHSTGFGDTASSSDSFSLNHTYSMTLSDSAVSSDAFSVIAHLGYVDGIVTEVLGISGNVPATFDNITRLIFITAGSSSIVNVAFDNVVREVLCLNYETPNNLGPIPIFPTLPYGFPVKVTPVMQTIVAKAKSLREARSGLRNNPTWDIEILFEGLKDQTQNQTPYAPFATPTAFTQYQTLVANWLMMYGQANVFGFWCEWDNSRANQIIGTGDGATYAFPVVRTWGSGALATEAAVGLIGTVYSLQVGGVTVPSTQYTVGRDTIYFIDAKGFIYPPANGATIKLTFSYYYLCHFVSDEQDFEEFAKNRWTVPSLKFRASLWQTV